MWFEPSHCFLGYFERGCTKFSRGKYNGDGLFSLNHSLMSNAFTQCVPVHIIYVTLPDY
jgi:hypothetical protein